MLPSSVVGKVNEPVAEVPPVPGWPSSPGCVPPPGGAAAWICATVSRPPVTRACPDWASSTVTAQAAPPAAQEKRTPPRSTDFPAATEKLPAATGCPSGSVAWLVWGVPPPPVQAPSMIPAAASAAAKAGLIRGMAQSPPWRIGRV